MIPVWFAVKKGFLPTKIYSKAELGFCLRMQELIISVCVGTVFFWGGGHPLSHWPHCTRSYIFKWEILGALGLWPRRLQIPDSTSIESIWKPEVQSSYLPTDSGCIGDIWRSATTNHTENIRITSKGQPYSKRKRRWNDSKFKKRTKPHSDQPHLQFAVSQKTPGWGKPG